MTPSTSSVHGSPDVDQSGFGASGRGSGFRVMAAPCISPVSKSTTEFVIPRTPGGSGIGSPCTAAQLWKTIRLTPSFGSPSSTAPTSGPRAKVIREVGMSCQVRKAASVASTNCWEGRAPAMFSEAESGLMLNGTGNEASGHKGGFGDSRYN